MPGLASLSLHPLLITSKYRNKRRQEHLCCCCCRCLLSVPDLAPIRVFALAATSRTAEHCFFHFLREFLRNTNIKKKYIYNALLNCIPGHHRTTDGVYTFWPMSEWYMYCRTQGSRAPGCEQEHMQGYVQQVLRSYPVSCHS